MESIEGRLCVECGLCCDGSLFEDVELVGIREATRMEALGLACDEEEGQHLLLHPCARLEGTRCGVYAHRPECCRTFRCGLLNRVYAGELGVSGALKVVRRVQGLQAEGKVEDARRVIERRFLECD